MNFIVLTALLVATDAFFIGLFLGLQKAKQSYFFIINGIIFLMCLIFYILAGLVKKSINFDTSPIAGTFFLLMGLRNLVSNPNKKNNVFTVKDAIIIGFVMSVDGIVATVTLTMDQTPVILIPAAIAASHLTYMFAGSFLARRIKWNCKISQIISCICFIGIGISNILF